MSVIDKVLAYVDRQIGKAYSQANRWTENSFDCSSLVYRAFDAAGVKLVHKDTGGKVCISSDECYAKGFALLYPDSYSKIGKTLPSPSSIVEKYQPGDIIFCCTDSSTARSNKITHVMIVNQYGGITHAGNPASGVEKIGKNTYSTKVCALLRYQGEGYTGSTTNSESEEKTENKEITSIQVVYGKDNKPVAKGNDQLKGVRNLTDNAYEILIEHKGNIMIPVVCEGVTVEYSRRSTAGKLQCKVLKDDNLDFHEGDAISFQVNGSPYFYGYIFQKSRVGDGIINITAYDQLRYLKNKDTLIFGGTATELLQLIAKNFSLKLGSGVENTNFSVQTKLFDNKTLFDMLEETLDDTLIATGKNFVLYDDFGFLFLKDMENMILDDFLIDDTNIQDFSYSTSIDSNTYNKIKLAYDNKETGVREIFQTQDDGHMADWGTLQYYEKISSKELAKVRLDAYLKIYNRKTRSLQIKGVFGNIRVRAGTGIYINLDIGDIILDNRMWVEKVKHTFEQNLHTMDLTLKGWEFVE
ncbi:MAG: NlpC/P60 family protein [Candidatus Gastranaerophilales bacterium]|nr:NlpC/P60 family protein [Candidatus Gastranaerophilales bacterium]